MKKTTKVVDVYIYKHNDITVTVKIDYTKGKISLVDGNREKHQEFIFANRGIEYMQGWLNILEAMQEAIKDARKRLEDELEERSKTIELPPSWGLLTNGENI